MKESQKQLLMRVSQHIIAFLLSCTCVSRLFRHVFVCDQVHNLSSSINLVPDGKTQALPPSSEYDDPADLERTMDDIAHDLETLHAVEDVKKKASALSTHEDHPSASKDETSREVAVDDSGGHLTPSIKSDDDLETPRANVFVNQVEISQRDDEDAEDESFRYVSFWKNERDVILLGFIFFLLNYK